MTAQELKIGDTFRYFRYERWSPRFTVEKIIDLPTLNNILIEAAYGKKVLLNRTKEVRIAQ